MKSSYIPLSLGDPFPSRLPRYFPLKKMEQNILPQLLVISTKVPATALDPRIKSLEPSVVNNKPSNGMQLNS